MPVRSSSPPKLTEEPSLTLADRLERYERALTAEELAGLLAVSRVTIFKQAKAGRIPSFRIGTCVRFDPRSRSPLAAYSVTSGKDLVHFLPDLLTSGRLQVAHRGLQVRVSQPLLHGPQINSSP